MTSNRVFPPAIDIMRTVFPVVAVRPDDHGEAARPDFFGTAFAVAPGWFLTAAHVAIAAEAAGQLAVGGPADGGGPAMGVAKVVDVEKWPERDLALLRCDVRGIGLLNTWLTHRVQVLSDLRSFGYPHGVSWSPSGDRLNVVFRAYKGYVITVRGFERLPEQPAIYEVSCPFPQGLSGAPVMITDGERLIVVGIVLGVDTVTYGGVPQSVGVALIADEIVGLNSHLLGGRLAAKLNFTGVTQHYALDSDRG
jgi:hypothetical protein